MGVNLFSKTQAQSYERDIGNHRSCKRTQQSEDTTPSAKRVKSEDTTPSVRDPVGTTPSVRKGHRKSSKLQAHAAKRVKSEDTTPSVGSLFPENDLSRVVAARIPARGQVSLVLYQLAYEIVRALAQPLLAEFPASSNLPQRLRTSATTSSPAPTSSANFWPFSLARMKRRAALSRHSTACSSFFASSQVQAA